MIIPIHKCPQSLSMISYAFKHDLDLYIDIFLHNTQYAVPQMSSTLMVSINLHHKVQKNTLILQ